MTVSNRPTLKRLLLAATMLAAPLTAAASMAAAAEIGISVQLEPPALPVYEQPPIPAPGYLWTPGYWAYDGTVGYYWVPGTWVQPPEVNLLWTPPYWAWADGVYVFHEGYWGPHVGFYGGIDYGFGYGGVGYEGGRWDGGVFTYNRTVNNFGGVEIAHAYEAKVTVVNHTRVSFNGGANGVKAEPTQAELAVEHEHHLQATALQTRNRTVAEKTPALAAKQNGGRPQIAATPRPGQFEEPGNAPGRAGGNEHPAAPAAAPRLGEQAVPRPEDRPLPHPDEHPVPRPEARPDEHPVARPDEHPVARPDEHPVARPDEHPVARPDEHPVPRPGERPVGRPEEHPAPRPGERPAPPAAEHRQPEHPAPKEEEKKPPQL